MDRFDSGAVYMTELALVPQSSPLHRSRLSTSSRITSESSNSDHRRSFSRPRRIYANLANSHPQTDPFAEPGSVSPSSDTAPSHAPPPVSYMRGRQPLHLKSSSYDSSDRYRLYSKPLSPSLWLSNTASRHERSLSPSSVSTFRSGVARPVRVHHFSMPNSSGTARPGSAASLYTVRSIDTTPRSPTTEASPQIYSCEFAQAVKIVRVTLPAPARQTEPVSPSTRPVSRSSSISDADSISTIGTSNKSDISTNPDQHSKEETEQLRKQFQPQERQHSPSESRSSKSSFISAPSLSSENGRCPSRASTVSDMSTSFGSRPTTPLSFWDENGDSAGDDEDRQSRRKWRWLSKAKTKSRHFMGLISETA